MADFDPNVNQEPQEEQKQSYTPASFEKRVAAWMGIVYVLMFLFIITFSLYRAGQPLTGTFPLFLVPVAVAAIVTSIYKQSKGTARGGLPTTIFIIILCLAAIFLGLALGVPALIAAFAG